MFFFLKKITAFKKSKYELANNIIYVTLAEKKNMHQVKTSFFLISVTTSTKFLQYAAENSPTAKNCPADMPGKFQKLDTTIG